jgi:hypothetical protein
MRKNPLIKKLKRNDIRPTKLKDLINGKFLLFASSHQKFRGPNEQIDQLALHNHHNQVVTMCLF